MLRTAERKSANGLVEATVKVKDKGWKDWTLFCQFDNVDPWLRNTNVKRRIKVFCAFAQWVREGNAGMGNQVKYGSVSKALAAVGSKFELDGQPNPLYAKNVGKKEYWRQLKLQMLTYETEDPPPRPKLAVPVALAHHAYKYARTGRNPKTEATGDLVNIAFYYLLRVGEYTYDGKRQRKRTRQFRVRDITFWAEDGTVIPNTEPLEVLLTATEATMTISNQKNGTRGQVIHHEMPNNTEDSPLSSLAYRVAHIMAHTNNQDTPISAYFTKKHTMQHVYAGDINTFIKRAVKSLDLEKKGFVAKYVSSHSLRAGGAMAMRLNGILPDTIKKYGRWSSETWTMYIHEQISALATGVSSAMSNHIHFHNISGPTVGNT